MASLGLFSVCFLVNTHTCTRGHPVVPGGTGVCVLAVGVPKAAFPDLRSQQKLAFGRRRLGS